MAVFHIDKLANIGVQVQIAGKPRTVRQLTLGDQGVLQDIIRRVEPNPFAVATEMAKGLPDSLAKEIIFDGKKSAKAWPSSVNSPEGIEILVGSAEGQRAILKTSMRLSDEEVEEVMGLITYVEFMRLAAIAISGDDPGEVTADPKAPEVPNPIPPEGIETVALTISN